MLPQWTISKMLSTVRSFKLAQNISKWLTQIMFNWIFLSENQILKVTRIRSETIKKLLLWWHVFHHSTWKWTMSLIKENANWAGCWIYAKYLLHMFYKECRSHKGKHDHSVKSCKAYAQYKPQSLPVWNEALQEYIFMFK